MTGNNQEATGNRSTGLVRDLTEFTYLFEDSLIEELLQLLITVIDTELFVTVDCEVLKPCNV